MEHNLRTMTRAMVTLGRVFAAGFLLHAATLSAAPPDQPTQLRMNHADNPLGIDTPKPQFGWIVNDPDRNETQTMCITIRKPRP